MSSLKNILENKIIQVHKSKGISMNQKYPTYKDNVIWDPGNS